MTTSAFQLEGVKADSYAEPSSVEELVEGIASSHSAGRPAFVFGAGSRLRFGNAAAAFSTAFSTRRLDRIVAYTPEDLVIAVEPGVTVSQIRKVLEEHGQHLAIDVADPDAETIGGLFASGLSGPRRLLYGSLKDSTLGIEVIEPDGTQTKAGGMVVKNVTGYDLPRLHYGAHGAFGAIARLNFKVLPAPERTSELTATFGSVDDAHNVAAALLQSHMDLTALYLTWHKDRPESECWRIHASVSGSESTVSTQLERAEELVESVAKPADIARNDTSGGDLQGFRPYINLRSDYAIARISVPASNQAHMGAVLSRAGSHSLCADLGSGLIYVRGFPTIEWREAIRRIDNRSVFLSLPVELRHGIDVFGGLDSVQVDLMGRLKQEYDPGATLNRGRFVLGL